MLFSFVALSLSAIGQVSTSQYDNSRTGANLHETVLTPRNVNPAQFGLLFRMPVEGDVYAQPLFLPGVSIPGKGLHDIVYVATEHDTVYAFDAGGKPAEPLWKTSLATGRVTSMPADAIRCPFIEPEIGITSTPVIDPAAGTIYVLARTRESGEDGTLRFYQRLHALDVATGAERPGSPVPIRGSVTSKSGGAFGLFSGPLNFNAFYENPRAALTLASGTLWLTWASSCDIGPYHGWVITYEARTLRQTGVFNTSPDSTESGIWAADAGPAVDAAGNFYVSTGNGTFDAASGGHDYGDSVLRLRLRRNGISADDYFTPFDQAHLDGTDADLGSGGVVLLPDQTGPHPHLLATAGKGGVLYLVDRDHMGHFHSGDDSHAVATARLGGHGIFGAPAWWNGRLYVLASGEVLKAFTINGGRISPQPVSQAAGTFHEPGATPTISANGTRDGIVWATESRGWNHDGPARLHAWDAADLNRELYDSAVNFSRDGAGAALRFTIPLVANGRVYIGTRAQVDVYGLLAPPPARRR